jgi:hydroxymethylbilane synthase
MIRFGSRGSDLALAQTRAIATELRQRTGQQFAIEVIETKGDKNIGKPIAEIGGKGLFTAELETALREGHIDVAVHSLKDLPVEDPNGLTIGAIPERENPRDVLVFATDARDPEGGTIPLLGECVVGTSSPRRSSALLSARPDLQVSDIRGNIDTRVRKVRDGEYHATVLAAAGLSRLGLDTAGLERVELPVDAFTPAPGQGALGIQCRANDARILGLLAAVNDRTAADCVSAERSLLLALGGGCSMPLGALVTPIENGFRMIASLFSETRPTCGAKLDVTAASPHRLAAIAADEFAPFLGDPLEGLTVALLRPGGAGGSLGRALGLAGADVETVAVSEILPLENRTAELTAGDTEIIAFTSARAVDRFFEDAAAFGIDLRSSRFFAGGPATAVAVRRRGHDCTAPQNDAGGRALGELIVTTLDPIDCASAVLFPCAEDRLPEFETTLLEAGFSVGPLPVYRTAVLPGVEIPEADHVVFSSPTAVRAYDTGRHEVVHESLLALGPTTADAMASVGLPPRAIAAAPTAKALVQLMRTLS